MKGIATIFSLAVVVPTLGQFDNDELFRQETNCPKFKCSKGRIPVQKAATKKRDWPVVYGCEESAFSMMTMMDMDALNGGPKKGGNREKLWKCCVGRDVAQQVCGLPKKTVEDDFTACSNKKCKGDKNCKMQAGFGLMMGGGLNRDDKCGEYNQFQQDNCECIDEADKPKQFKKALKSFYSVFEKSKLPKSGELDDEFLDNTVYKKFKRGEEAKIWFALFQKYSSKMQHKEKPKPDYGDYLRDADREYDDALGTKGKGRKKGKNWKKEKDIPYDREFARDQEEMDRINKDEPKDEEPAKTETKKKEPKEEEKKTEPKSVLDEPPANFGEEEIIEEEL